MEYIYYPYFRGKQYELIAIRENAQLMAKSGFTPIIEPVQKNLNGLERAVSSIANTKGKVVVIVNPQHGIYSGDGQEIVEYIQQMRLAKSYISPAILLNEKTELAKDLLMRAKIKGSDITLIHAGYPDAKDVTEFIGGKVSQYRHVFIDSENVLYRRHFADGNRILIRDGFTQRRNKDHPPRERFSDLHITYKEANMDGFGDFLIVGNEYSESGGPAYAVAIHLTYIDPDQDNAMFVAHFISDRQDSPTDTPGKFAEALENMIAAVDSNKYPFAKTEAIAEFRDLHNRDHFPGLGYVKKLSMQHHLETLSDYLGSK